MALLRPLFSLLSPAGEKGRLSVLIFHRVLLEADNLFPEEMDAERFDNILSWIKSWFNVLPLDDAVHRIKSGTLPARAASITFDDGYADNFTVALPLLKRHGLCATFFIATGFLDGGRMWNDTVIEAVRVCPRSKLDLVSLGMGQHQIQSIAQKRSAIDAIIGKIKYETVAQRNVISAQIAKLTDVVLPTNLMMTSAQVRSLHGYGMRIGAHTVSHPILARLAPSEVRQEIQQSKLHLESLLGERVGLFAYPNGIPNDDYRPEDAEIVRELGFDAAMSTAWGAAGPGCDIMQLPRFTPWDQTKTKFGIRLALNLGRRT